MRLVHRERQRMQKNTGKFYPNMRKQKEVTCVALVYREGDTVVLGEVADEVLPNFLVPLLARYGFDSVKWIVANPKR